MWNGWEEMKKYFDDKDRSEASEMLIDVEKIFSRN